MRRLTGAIALCLSVATVVTVDAGASGVPLTHGLRGAVADVTDGGDFAAKGVKNSAIALLRKRAAQYEKDAQEAASEAVRYTALAKSAWAEMQLKDSIAQTTRDEMARSDVPRLARNVQHIANLLADTRAAKAAKAASEVRTPYEARYKEYKSAAQAYTLASVGYAAQAKRNSQSAASAESYAMQYRMEGDRVTADQYSQQSRLLSKQSQQISDLASKYGVEAAKLQATLPKIKAAEEAAAKFAAWQENPTGVVPIHEVYTLTIAPPLQKAGTKPPALLGPPAWWAAAVAYTPVDPASNAQVGGSPEAAPPGLQAPHP